MRKRRELEIMHADPVTGRWVPDPVCRQPQMITWADFFTVLGGGVLWCLIVLALLEWSIIFGSMESSL